MSYLEKRQEWVLSQINRLQEKVKSLAENMGVGPADVGILQQEVNITMEWLALKTIVIFFQITQSLMESCDLQDLPCDFFFF